MRPYGHLKALLPSPKQRLAAAQFSLAVLSGGTKQIESATSKVSATQIPLEAKNLLRYEMVQLPLAAERIRSKISNGYFGDLEQRLPRKLIKLVGRCADTPQTINQLVKLLGSRRGESSHAMAASIMVAGDPSWQLPSPKSPWNFAGGIFCGANWPRANLWRANLTGCDFSEAELEAAKLDEAYLTNASFDGARLILRFVERSSGDGQHVSWSIAATGKAGRGLAGQCRFSRG